MAEQTVFFIVQISKREERFIAFGDGSDDTLVIDEAQVYYTYTEAHRLLKNAPNRRVRQIECHAGQPTKLLPE